MASEAARDAVVQIGKLLGLLSTDQHRPGVTHGDVADIIDATIAKETDHLLRVKKLAGELLETIDLASVPVFGGGVVRAKARELRAEIKGTA